MSLTLKDCVNPWKAADNNLLVSEQLAVSALDRLQAVLLDSATEVAVNLQFERDEERLPLLKGHLHCTLKLECQRCLQPMDLPLDHHFTMAFVHAGAAVDPEDTRFSELYDLYEVEDEKVFLVNVIEDELLLLLPQVPMHSAPECVIKTEFGDEQSETVDSDKENPFAVLASLKDKLNS